MKKDFQDTFWSQNDLRLPIYFGIHFVKILVENSSDLGISSPNCFHQDGEPFTFAHLVKRTENTSGGINYIAKPSNRNMRLEDTKQNDILLEFKLNNFLDSFAVHDPIVSHYVSPIYKEIDKGDPAERSIILIDFSTTVQKI